MIDIKDYVSDDSAKESEIYEDPAIKYDFKDSVQRQAESKLDMDSYLIPFKHWDFNGSEAASESSEEELDLRVTRSPLSEYAPASTGIYNSPASSVTSLEICRLTPGHKLDYEEGDRWMLQPSAQCVKLLQCADSKRLTPQLGESPVSTPHEIVMDLPKKSVDLLLQTLQESLGDESVATSVDDLRKQLHISRAAVAVHQLRPPSAERMLSLTSSVDLTRRGLKIDRFIQKRKREVTRMRGIAEQTIFLDIYENKEALHKRMRRKHRNSLNAKLKSPSFSKRPRVSKSSFSSAESSVQKRQDNAKGQETSPKFKEHVPKTREGQENAPR
ncbi:uncharacterized protein LOC144491898 [Mustelus asterias]